MSDHEFEKQVRQKLSDLKLTPSPQAWENIEQKLRERRRRAPFLWLPFLLAGLIAGGYFVLSTNTQKSRTASNDMRVPTQNTAPTAQNPQPVGKERSALPAAVASDSGQAPLTPDHGAAITSPLAATVSPVTRNQDERPLSAKEPLRESPLSVSKHNSNHTGRAVHTDPDSLTSKEHTDHTGAPSGKPLLLSKLSIGRARGNHGKLDDRRFNDKTEDIGSEKPAVDQSKKDPAWPNPADGLISGTDAVPVDQHPEDSLAVTKSQDLPTGDTEKAVALLKPDVTQKSAAAKIPTKTSKLQTSKWSFAADVHSGISFVSKGGLFGVGNTKVEDIAYTANFVATVVNYAPVYKPSTISPGFTFSAGGEVKRELSKRFSASAGLNYTQLNTRSTLGERINNNNLVNNGVRGYLYVQSYGILDPLENKEDNNRYHFIELPLTLHTRLTGPHALPAYWDAGFILSRLISSTSLHFDGNTGVYYQDDKLLNQTQAAVATGFSVALFNKTRLPLWIGPTVRSNITPVLKKNASDNKHFVTLGLNLKLLLKK